jgi:biotin synthase
MPGTPLAEKQGVDVFELVRIIALARLSVPRAKVRLSAGRTQLSEEAQALCFFAGANSIFYGDKLLTAKNPAIEKDLALINRLGMKPQEPNRNLEAPDSDESRPADPQLL